MPRKRTQKNYFGEEQEQAVVRFLESESEQEKNKIFNEYLKEPLIIMVESIIRRYKLYRKDYEFNDTHADTMSFLMTKINKYKPIKILVHVKSSNEIIETFDEDFNIVDYLENLKIEFPNKKFVTEKESKKQKAYSYFGTICKNYLMGAIQKDTKETNRSISYEDVSSDLEESEKHSYIIDEVFVDYRDVIIKFTIELEEFMEKENMNENEQKLGFALLEIFNNFDKIFQVGDGNKFNKNLILLSLREMTSLSTKEIRIALRRYKKLYDGTLKGFIN